MLPKLLLKQVTPMRTVALVLLSAAPLSGIFASKTVTITNHSGEAITFYITSNGNPCGATNAANNNSFGMPATTTTGATTNSKVFVIPDKVLVGCSSPAITLVGGDTGSGSTVNISQYNAYSCAVSEQGVIGCTPVKNDEY